MSKIRRVEPSSVRKSKACQDPSHVQLSIHLRPWPSFMEHRCCFCKINAYDPWQHPVKKSCDSTIEHLKWRQVKILSMTKSYSTNFNQFQVAPHWIILKQHQKETTTVGFQGVCHVPTFNFQLQQRFTSRRWISLPSTSAMASWCPTALRQIPMEPAVAHKQP